MTTPANAQQAALRILLEDVEPLLQRAEALAGTLEGVRQGLDTDLRTLTSLMQRSVDAQPALLETGRRLSGSAARIEMAMKAADIGAATRARARTPSRMRLPMCVLGAVVCALLGAGAVTLSGRDCGVQARLGQALQRGWPSLDALTRSKVEAALQR